jgi:hypothetical protein
MNYWRKDKTKYESVVTTQHAVGVGFVGTGGRHTHDTYVGVRACLGGLRPAPASPAKILFTAL